MSEKKVDKKRTLTRTLTLTLALTLTLSPNRSLILTLALTLTLTPTLTLTRYVLYQPSVPSGCGGYVVPAGNRSDALRTMEGGAEQQDCCTYPAPPQPLYPLHLPLPLPTPAPYPHPWS